jgi:hypothetical protein
VHSRFKGASEYIQEADKLLREKRPFTYILEIDTHRHTLGRLIG